MWVKRLFNLSVSILPEMGLRDGLSATGELLDSVAPMRIVLIQRVAL